MSRQLGTANLPVLASAPSSPAEGDAYYNSADDTIYVCTNGTGPVWKQYVSEATRTASGTGTIEHGSTAGTARPTGYYRVVWIGTVTPSNASDGDLWVDTT